MSTIDKLNAATANEFMEEILSYQERLAATESTVMREFPEDLFLLDFLPKFANPDYFLTEGPENTALIGEWLKVAGSYNNAVELVDRAGRVRYVVPPLTEVKLFDGDNARGDITLAFNEYSNRSRSPSGCAPAFMNRTILPAMDKLIKEPTGFVAQWEAMFQHYSVKSPFRVKAKSVNTSVTPTDNGLRFEDD